MADSGAAAAGRRLVVIDDYDGGWIERARAEAPAAIWHVLPLGIDHRWYRERHGASLDALGACTFLDSTGAARTTHDAIRDFLVPFIAEVPRRKGPDGRLLVDTLASRAGNLWWYLETSEKSPMRGPLVSQLYALGLVRATVDADSYDQVWLALADGAVRDVLFAHADRLPRLISARPRQRAAARGWSWYWWQALRQVAELGAYRVLARAYRWPHSRASGRPAVFFSFFPGWWSAPYSERAVDRFFPELPDAHGDVPLRRAVWLTESVSGLWTKRRELGAALRRQKFLTLQDYVPLRSAAALLSAGGFLRARRFCRDARHHLSAFFAGFDVLPLIAADIRRSFTTGEMFRDRLLADALRRMTSIVKPVALIFRCEGQPVDRALTHGVGDRALSVGFWHVPMDRHYLPLHFGVGTIARALAHQSPEEPPVPARMLVTGTAGADALERQGYPRERIAICGPVRQPQLSAYRASRPNRAALRARLGLPQDLPVFFAATSIVRTDSEGLLSALVEALEPIKSFRLIVKLHPALSLDTAFLQWIFNKLGPGRASFMPDAGSMYDYIAASDVMLVAGSTIAFEAMALDVMPIAFESPSSFSASSLEDFASACFVTRTARELRAAIELTIAGAPAAREKQRGAPSAIARALGFVDRPPQLLTALQELGV